jgi:hypothetical protein
MRPRKGSNMGGKTWLRGKVLIDCNFGKELDELDHGKQKYFSKKNNFVEHCRNT